MYGNHRYRVSELVCDRQRPNGTKRKTWSTREQPSNDSLPLYFMQVAGRTQSSSGSLLLSAAQSFLQALVFLPSSFCKLLFVRDQTREEPRVRGGQDLYG